MSEAVMLGPGEGRRFWTSLSHGTVKVESGRGDFCVFESSPPPGQPGPAPHVHRSYDEAWLVLAGTVEFVVDGASHRAEPGSFVFVPCGIPHSFANPGPGAARMLVIGSSPVQAMIEELGNLAAGGGPPQPPSPRSTRASTPSSGRRPEPPA
jgi:mannose-6-phosphate isomerase-like protein (cupin superfamily)